MSRGWNLPLLFKQSENSLLIFMKKSSLSCIVGALCGANTQSIRIPSPLGMVPSTPHLYTTRSSFLKSLQIVGCCKLPINWCRFSFNRCSLFFKFNKHWPHANHESYLGCKPMIGWHSNMFGSWMKVPRRQRWRCHHCRLGDITGYLLFGTFCDVETYYIESSSFRLHLYLYTLVLVLCLSRMRIWIRASIENPW